MMPLPSAQAARSIRLDRASLFGSKRPRDAFIPCAERNATASEIAVMTKR
jgi:hypothetical protein